MKGSTATAVEAAIDFTGGTLGGAATVFVGQPLDTVKVKMQTFPSIYRGAFHCFMITLRKEGVSKGLYRGTVPSLVANVAENSVLFMFYGVCQTGIAKISGKKIHELQTLQNACAGFCAAFFSSFALCPTELIKCKLQTLHEMSHSGAVASKHIGSWQLTRQIIDTEGIRGMFRGLTSTMAREMPGYFCFFGGYELARSYLTPKGKTKDEIGVTRTIIAGGFGGWCFWAAIFPADVIKSRIQIMKDHISFIGLFRKILKEEGVRSLYAGITPSLLRTFPATGALFVTFEYTKKFLGFLVNRDHADL